LKVNQILKDAQLVLVLLLFLRLYCTSERTTLVTSSKGDGNKILEESFLKLFKHLKMFELLFCVANSSRIWASLERLWADFRQLSVLIISKFIILQIVQD